MRLLQSGIAISLLFFSSCKLTEESMIGTYKPAKNSATRLILKEDKTFELALLDPQRDSLVFPVQSSTNFYTKGNWKLTDKHKLVLYPASDQPKDQPGSAMDSISRFTNITSFNFWNRYGEPVSIRYILVPPAKPKPHYGNSLYFFSQDFNSADTLKFYFDGYSPVKYPGTIPYAIGNNIHKITLVENYQAQPFPEIGLSAAKNRLSFKEKSMVFEKRK